MPWVAMHAQSYHHHINRKRLKRGPPQLRCPALLLLLLLLQLLLLQQLPLPGALAACASVATAVTAAV